MTLPTIKKIMSIGLDKPTAVAVRAYLAWIIQRPYNNKPTQEDWNAVNRMLDGFGDEYIASGRNAKSPSIHYINLGDTYRTTLMFVRGRWVVGCWGDIVERGNYS